MSNSVKRSPRARRSHRRHLIVSCEHGGNRVPHEYRAHFVGADAALASHRGMDFGALELARAFGRRLGIKPFTATTTRLVVDLNRSPGHRNLFSAFTRSLSEEERAAALERYYWPYRNAVERAVAAAVAADGSALHISAHSFTPALDGEVRDCDVAFLYDPARPIEVRLVDAWYAALGNAAPALRLRRNYPYRGTSDALVTHLRRRFGPRRYGGIELEVNQKHVGAREWRALVRVLAGTLDAAV